jgi:hypothetical protein
MLFSAGLNFAAPGIVLRNVYWTNDYGPDRNTFNPNFVLLPRDWPFWAPTPQEVVNGVAPVLPGYADGHLGREIAMFHSRDDGAMYHAQWRRALELRPELVVVYSWNEHFEETAIEPTDQWGTRYLEWTRCYVAQARAATAADCR